MPKDKVETQGVSQYEPSDAERKALRRQFRRKKKQTPAPRLNIVAGDYGTRIEKDHPHGPVANSLLMEAVGTADEDFYRGLLDQLSSLIDVEDSSDHQNASETDLNFLLSVIKTGKPKFECHSMLLAHIGVTHRLCMGLAKDTLDNMRMSPGEGELSRGNEMLSFYERKSRLLQFNVRLLNKSSCPEQPRRLAALDATPELPFRRHDEVLVEWIGIGRDLHPFTAPGYHRQDRRLCRNHPHIVLQLRHTE